MFDIVFLLIFALFAFKGFFSHFKSEVISFITLLIGIVVSLLFHYELFQFVDQYLNKPALSKVLTFMGIIVGAVLIGSLLSLLIKVPEKNVPGFFSRLAAAVVGLGKGFLINFCIYVIVSAYLPLFSDEIASSYFKPFFKETFSLIKLLD